MPTWRMNHLVGPTLARAIKTESAAALKFWFGVGTKAVWNWRRAFGVGRLGTPGSAAAHAAASGKGAAAVRGRPVGPARQKQLRRRLMKARAAVRWMPPACPTAFFRRAA